MRVRASRELERAVERLDLGVRVAVRALSEAEGDPGHENLLGGAELLRERKDPHALFERDALARKQGRTPGERPDPCCDARLRKVGDECDRPLVVRQRRLLSAAEAIDIAQVGLGFRRRLDLADGPEPIGGLLQLRDPLRPQPGEGSPPLQQQARVVGIVLGPELERPARGTSLRLRVNSAHRHGCRPRATQSGPVSRARPHPLRRPVSAPGPSRSDAPASRRCPLCAPRRATRSTRPRGRGRRRAGHAGSARRRHRGRAHAGTRTPSRRPPSHAVRGARTPSARARAAAPRSSQAPSSAIAATAPEPEHLPDHRGVLEQRLLLAPTGRRAGRR